jgi:hypothetical protein
VSPATGGADGPTDEEVVRAAADAAEGVIFERYKQSDVADVDVTVTFEDGVLDVDVYLNPPADAPDADAVADEAARAAAAAVDDLFAAAGTDGADGETTDGAGAR